MSWPILELARSIFRSGHCSTVWYHRYSEAPFTVDELELYEVLEPQRSLYYILEIAGFNIKLKTLHLV
jgi:hypothetical protein